MKHSSRTLLALAVLSPAIFALDVKNDDLKLGLKLQLQVRAEKSWASNVSGGNYLSYAASEALSNAQSDTVDFYIRRARIGFAGTYKGEYKFAFLLRDDNQDKKTSSSRLPETHYAYIERLIKQEDLGLEHAVRMGLDYAWFNGASAAFSSSSFLFPTERVTAGMVGPRGVGAGYKMTHKMVQWGVDVQNNSKTEKSALGQGYTGAPAPGAPNGDGANATNTGYNGKGGEGLFIGTRVQVIPFDSDEKGHMKPVESFLGKDGTGVLLSAEYGRNQGDNVGTDTFNTTAFGFELLGHYNQVTALAEWRQAKTNLIRAVGANDTNVATAYLVQFGFALPLGDQVIEPAFRWTHLNSDGDVREAGPFGGEEYGASGNSFDLGVNYYIHGHSNKLQLAWQHWRAEEATKIVDGTAASYPTPTADNVRFQWQLSF